jgi:hypothetical protein
MDLHKINEAVQACHRLIEMRSKHNESSKVPELDARCIQGLVGESLNDLDKAVESGDKAAIESAERTVGRVEDLLKKLKSTMTYPWLWEICAFFNERRGKEDFVLEDLMKEYRSLVASHGWERDASPIKKICNLASQISDMNQRTGIKGNLSKSRLMLRSLLKKVEAGNEMNEQELPEEVAKVREKLSELEEALKSMS